MYRTFVSMPLNIVNTFKYFPANSHLLCSIAFHQDFFNVSYFYTKKHERLIYISERSLRTHVDKVDSKQTNKNSTIEPLEDYLSTSTPKPSRIPSQLYGDSVDTELSDFTVENFGGKKEDTSKSQPTKAINFALKLRKEKGQKRSPFHSLNNMELDPVKRAVKNLKMPDLSKMKNEDLARTIRRNVIFADKRLVIFNKPYGLPLHDGENTSQHIKNVLPMVSKMIYGVNTDVHLHVCNRLDKFTTGVCVTTVDKEMTSHVKKMFREHKVLRKYWAITLGVPDPAVGVIDIPLDRAIVEATNSQSYARMVARPEVRYDELTHNKVKIRARGHTAITYYKTLACTSLALLELQPQTTVKHQLRVHLADGLACPILGDHKYSHFGKLAPQNLPSKVLKRFGIPSAKSRHTPLHLHLQSVIIPGVFPDQKKANLMIGAKTSVHMTRTMNMFRLKAGPPTEWRATRACTSPQETAAPRDKNSQIYFDPTSSYQPDEEDADFDSNCVKIFRNNTINVKYKHR